MTGGRGEEIAPKVIFPCPDTEVSARASSDLPAAIAVGPASLRLTWMPVEIPNPTVEAQATQALCFEHRAPSPERGLAPSAEEAPSAEAASSTDSDPQHFSMASPRDLVIAEAEAEMTMEIFYTHPAEDVGRLPYENVL